jgi:hypothetical protein
MIESFLYWTWICGQVLYWFFLRHETAICTEESWRMLCILSSHCPVPDVDAAVPTAAAPCCASS